MTRKSRSKHADKYPLFLKWNDPDDIPAKELAAQWNVKPQVVYSLIGVAKRNPKIYLLLKNKLGYSDEEIPRWIARPDEYSETGSDQGEGGSAADEGLVSASEDGSGGSEGGAHTAPPPRNLDSNTGYIPGNSVPNEGEAQPSATYPTYTQPTRPISQLNHVNNTETVTELEDHFLENLVRDVVVSELSIKTQSIMKKVALNPSVLFSYNYLVNAMDTAKGIPYFTGDLADFLNFCVKFTMDKGLGIVPAMITGRPSLLQIMRQSEQQERVIPDYIPLWRHDSSHGEDDPDA